MEAERISETAVRVDGKVYVLPPQQQKPAPAVPRTRGEWEVHWAFYALTVDQRDRAWRQIDDLTARGTGERP